MVPEIEKLEGKPPRMQPVSLGTWRRLFSVRKKFVTTAIGDHPCKQSLRPKQIRNFLLICLDLRLCLQVWYPMAVATKFREQKKNLRQAPNETGCTLGGLPSSFMISGTMAFRFSSTPRQDNVPSQIPWSIVCRISREWWCRSSCELHGN